MVGRRAPVAGGRGRSCDGGVRDRGRGRGGGRGRLNCKIRFDCGRKAVTEPLSPSGPARGGRHAELFRLFFVFTVTDIAASQH